MKIDAAVADLLARRDFFSEEMKKILLDNIRKAMNDSEFTAPSLHEKKENVVDMNAMRANNLIKKLT